MSGQTPLERARDRIRKLRENRESEDSGVDRANDPLGLESRRGTAVVLDPQASSHQRRRQTVGPRLRDIINVQLLKSSRLIIPDSAKASRESALYSDGAEERALELLEDNKEVRQGATSRESLPDGSQTRDLSGTVAKGKRKTRLRKMKMTDENDADDENEDPFKEFRLLAEQAERELITNYVIRMKWKPMAQQHQEELPKLLFHPENFVLPDNPSLQMLIQNKKVFCREPPRLNERNLKKLERRIRWTQQNHGERWFGPDQKLKIAPDPLRYRMYRPGATRPTPVPLAAPDYDPLASLMKNLYLEDPDTGAAKDLNPLHLVLTKALPSSKYRPIMDTSDGTYLLVVRLGNITFLDHPLMTEEIKIARDVENWINMLKSRRRVNVVGFLTQKLEEREHRDALIRNDENRRKEFRKDIRATRLLRDTESQVDRLLEYKILEGWDKIKKIRDVTGMVTSQLRVRVRVKEPTMTEEEELEQLERDLIDEMEELRTMEERDRRGEERQREEEKKLEMETEDGRMVGISTETLDEPERYFSNEDVVEDDDSDWRKKAARVTESDENLNSNRVSLSSSLAHAEILTRNKKETARSTERPTIWNRFRKRSPQASSPPTSPTSQSDRNESSRSRSRLKDSTRISRQGLPPLANAPRPRASSRSQSRNAASSRSLIPPPLPTTPVPKGRPASRENSDSRRSSPNRSQALSDEDLRIRQPSPSRNRSLSSRPPPIPSSPPPRRPSDRSPSRTIVSDGENRGRRSSLKFASNDDIHTASSSRSNLTATNSPIVNERRRPSRRPHGLFDFSDMEPRERFRSDETINSEATDKKRRKSKRKGSKSPSRRKLSKSSRKPSLARSIGPLLGSQDQLPPKPDDEPFDEVNARDQIIEFRVEDATVFGIRVKEIPESIRIAIYEVNVMGEILLSEVFLGVPEPSETAKIQDHRPAHLNFVGKPFSRLNALTRSADVDLWMTGELKVHAVWGVDEMGNSLGPPLKLFREKMKGYKAIDPMLSSGPSGLLNLRKLMDWIKDAKLDSNDPLNAELVQLKELVEKGVEKGMTFYDYWTQREFFRLGVPSRLREECFGVGLSENTMTKRLCLLSARDQNKVVVSCPIPLRDEEIHDGMYEKIIDPTTEAETIQNVWSLATPFTSLASLETLETSDPILNTDASTSLRFLKRIRTNQLIHRARQTRPKRVEDFVREERLAEVPPQQNFMFTLFNAKRPLKPTRTSRSSRATAQPENGCYIGVQVQRAFNVPVRKRDVEFGDAGMKNNLTNGPVLEKNPLAGPIENSMLLAADPTSETMIYLFITLEPPLLQPPPMNLKFQSDEPQRLLHHCTTFTATFPAARPVPCTSLDLDGRTHLITRFIRPQQPPADLPSLRHILRYVAHVPVIASRTALAAQVWLWCTTDQVLELGAGDVIEHAVMLCNFLLNEKRVARVIMGWGVPEGRTAWVWGNIQPYVDPQRLNWNLGDIKGWRPLFGPKFPKMELKSLQAENLMYKEVSNKFCKNLEQKIETAVASKMEDGEGLDKSFKTLVNRLESDYLTNTTTPFTSALLPLRNVYRISGFPLHTCYTDVESIVEMVHSTDVHANADPGVEFALAVWCGAYPGGFDVSKDMVENGGGRV
ncbi:hypothetical protein BC829DRAFT_442050 [Chytridium lagenaria]|nr:hypothetical protein BC829DRAFT_442050 [Chytridium lagenaria]